MKLYPAIDIRGGNCVRLYQGDYDRETVYGDDPADQAARFADEGAEWEDRAAGILKAELARRKINYVKLSELLNDAYGIHEFQRNLSNKVRRGKFSAGFFLQVLEVIGCDKISIQ